MITTTNTLSSSFFQVTTTSHATVKKTVHTSFEKDTTKNYFTITSNGIDEKITALEKEKEALKELNNIKNKLFSIIAHDLRTPIYGIKNLFTNMHQNNVSVMEIKLLMPDIVHTINHTTNLMENLLLWSKSQMEGFKIKEELIDINEILLEAEKLVQPHAKSKQIDLQVHLAEPIHLFADKDMVSLVVRNLLNNAIKFTPTNGKVELIVVEEKKDIKVYVKDNGLGICKDKLKELFTNNCVSTNGTASEMGTGLGLVLCKEFIQKNGGQISVESTEGLGSIFSFSLQNNNYCSLYINQ
jgi:two-component system, sensor histidine kinase and response regulator